MSLTLIHLSFFFFFFNDTATTEIYTLSLHDALPICVIAIPWILVRLPQDYFCERHPRTWMKDHHPILRLIALGVKNVVGWLLLLGGIAMLVLPGRSEEHTSELQSLAYLVCRLLLEKKKQEISELI